MEDLTLINNTSVYRNPAPQSNLQGPGVMQPAIVYSKIMLRTIELESSDYEFDKLAIERLMESNNGANEIMFKRFLALAAHTQPLVEGIPPASDQGRMVAIKGTCKSYGRVMKFTDKVNWAVVDPLISEYTSQLSKKIPETKDILAQEALLAECQTFYASGKTTVDKNPDMKIDDSSYRKPNHIRELTSKCNPTIDEFRRIVLSMEAAKVRPHMGGNFLCLISAATEFDLVTDKRIREFMHDMPTGEPYKNAKVLALFKLVFKTAKTIKTDNSYVDENGDVRYLWEGGDSKSYANIYSTKNSIDEDSIKYAKAVVIDKISGDIDDNGGKGWDVTRAGNVITINGIQYDASTFDKLNVHHSFVLGDPQEVLFRIGVSGHTAPQFIKKELGSAGTEDPLNQRQSIGWKIDTLGYKVVNPDAVVDYMSIPSQFSVDTNPRPDEKNQFVDYAYGFKDAEGNYYYPEQVIETAEGYITRGSHIAVTACSFRELIKPIGAKKAHMLGANGKHGKVLGTIPTTQFAIINNGIVVAKFVKDQVESRDGKYYIKGTEAEVVKLPVVDAEGNVHEPEPEPNATGDKRIDE